MWNGDPDLDVRLGLQDDDDRLYEAAFVFEPSGRVAKVSRETIEISSNRLEFANELDSSRICRVIRGGRRDPDVDRRIAEQVHTLLAGVHFARWYPPLMALPVALAAARQYRIDPTGFGLAVCLDDILGYDRTAFTDLEDQLRLVFPALEAIRLSPEPAFKSPPDDSMGSPPVKAQQGKGLAFKFKGISQDVPASQVSDGLLLVLGYLALAHLPKPPAFVLVEEPENGVHPQRLRTVTDILRQVATKQRTQVVLTTHSPYVVDLFAPEEITVCRREQDGAVAVRRLSDSRIVQEQSSLFTLGEIWTSEGEEALINSAPDAVASKADEAS